MATDPTAGFINSLGNIPLPLLGLIAVAALVALGAYAAYWYIERNKQDVSFEKTPIKEILRERFDKRIEEFGWRNGSYLRQSYRELGVIVRDVKVTERLDNSGVDNESTINDYTDSFDDDKIDQFKDSGLISEKDAQDMKDNSIVDHRYSIVRDKGLGGFIGFYVIDSLLNKEEHHKRMLYPEICVKDAAHGNNVVIDKDVQFEPIAGMYAANTMATFALLEMAHYGELYERSLEAQENYFERLNFYDSEFAKSVQADRERGKIEKEKWQGVGNNHANNK